MCKTWLTEPPPRFQWMVEEASRVHPPLDFWQVYKERAFSRLAQNQRSNFRGAPIPKRRWPALPSCRVPARGGDTPAPRPAAALGRIISAGCLPHTSLCFHFPLGPPLPPESSSPTSPQMMRVTPAARPAPPPPATPPSSAQGRLAIYTPEWALFCVQSALWCHTAWLLTTVLLCCACELDATDAWPMRPTCAVTRRPRCVSWHL